MTRPLTCLGLLWPYMCRYLYLQVQRTPRPPSMCPLPLGACWKCRRLCSAFEGPAWACASAGMAPAEGKLAWPAAQLHGPAPGATPHVHHTAGTRRHAGLGAVRVAAAPAPADAGCGVRVWLVAAVEYQHVQGPAGPMCMHAYVHVVTCEDGHAHAASSSHRLSCMHTHTRAYAALFSSPQCDDAHYARREEVEEQPGQLARPPLPAQLSGTSTSMIRTRQV